MAVGWSINGDAFSDEIKDKSVELIREKMGKVELVIYSIASPRRIDPVSGNIYSTVIKPIGKPFIPKLLDFQTALFEKSKHPRHRKRRSSIQSR